MNPMAEPVAEETLDAPWRVLMRYDDVPSTQELAGELIQAGRDMRGVVLWAERQSRGHGRRERVWISESGGLYVTAGLPETKPNISLNKMGWVPLAGALACAELLRERLKLKAHIKWPNDVLIGGRKVAGLLGEVKQSNIILLGFGLNWLNAVGGIEGTGGCPACSVAEFCTEIKLEGRRALLLEWLARLARWQEVLAGEGEWGVKKIREAVESLLWKKGETVELVNTERVAVQGVLLGLGEGGGARVRSSDGNETLVQCGWQGQ